MELQQTLNAKLVDLNIKIEAHSKTIRVYTFWNKFFEIPSLLSSSLVIPIQGFISYTGIDILQYINIGVATLAATLQYIRKYNDYDKKIAIHINCVKIYSQILHSTESQIIANPENLKIIYQDLVNKLSVVDEQQDLLIPEDIIDKIRINNPIKVGNNIFRNINTLRKKNINLNSILPTNNDDEKKRENVIFEETTSEENSKHNISDLIGNVDKIMEHEELKALNIDKAKELIQHTTGQKISHIRNPSRDLLSKLNETKDMLISIKPQ